MQEDGPVALARALAADIESGGVPARLLGGLAIYLRCPSLHRPPLARSYNDLDLAVHRKQAASLEKALAVRGWEADRRFNALYGAKRMLFSYQGVDLDVFVGVFEQCHRMELDTRLGAHPVTLDLADLLLTKLQVVELNKKDLTDALGLLQDHPPAEGQSGETIDLSVICALTGSDWGWHTTISDNLQRITETAHEYLEPAQAMVVGERASAIQRAMEACPKTLAWRMRARVGRRLPWYVLPEEKQT